MTEMRLSSPALRQQRYRDQYRAQRVFRTVAALIYVDVFLVSVLVVGVAFQTGPTSWGLFATIVLFTVVMLLTGDLYEFVRDRIEDRVYCPRYDTASQPRPQFAIPNQPSPLRFAVYAVVAVGVPALLLLVLNATNTGGFIEMPVGANPIPIAAKLAAGFGLLSLRIPMSVRGILAFFKNRVPRPDSSY